MSTPPLSLDQHVAAVVEIVRAVDAANLAVGRRCKMLGAQLDDALDLIHELKSQIATKDNIIEELQSLQSRGMR